MSAPSKIRSTAGFRSLVLFDLNSSYYPIGSVSRQASNPYTVSGSVINSGSTVAIPAGTAISGSVPYYGARHSGAKVLTINDPVPRVLPHIGDDAVFSLQVLPALEPANGELHVDKTNDMVDAMVGGVKNFTIGEANIQGVATNMRGFENTVGAIAYSAGQDTDPDSANFGVTVWDFRIFPKAIVFARDTGYGQEANERLYSFTPTYVTSHIWGVAFASGVEGFTRAQMIRGVSQYKPTLCSWLGDGSCKGFPFDSAQPAQSASKVVVWKNGVLLSAGYSAGLYGISFAVAPDANDVIVAFYES